MSQMIESGQKCGKCSLNAKRSNGQGIYISVLCLNHDSSFTLVENNNMAKTFYFNGKIYWYYLHLKKILQNENVDKLIKLI